MNEDFIYWLLFLVALSVGLLFGSRYIADTAIINSLSVEVRSATQSAATQAFGAVSLENIGERKEASNRAHRGIKLDKSLARARFEDALKANLQLDANWVATSGRYMSKGKSVVMTALHIVDSYDLPFAYEGKTINEPIIIVALTIPVKLHSTNKETLEVVRTIPLRTFITNWQR